MSGLNKYNEISETIKSDIFNGRLKENMALYISDKLTILHGQSDHLSRRFRSLISERYGR